MKKQNALQLQGIASILAQDNLPQALIAPHSAPVYTSSTFVYESAEKAKQVFEGKAEAYIYSRWSHPNAEMVEKKIEALETYGLHIKAKTLCFSSGMAALSAMYQSLLRPGDVLLVQGNIYGTSVDFFNHYSSQAGVEVVYADFKDVKRLEEICKRKNVRLLYAETPSNPTIRCYDLKQLSVLANKYGAKLAVDNTFATPLLQQPLAYGVDIVLHSGTKYLNGHGTGLSGFLISTDVKWMASTVWKVRKLNGTICAPFDAWLLNVGLKTLPLRMKQHCYNAMKVALFLESHNAIGKVNYLGLKSHSDHHLAKKQMKDFGGVLSFELKAGYKASVQMMKKVKLCKLTASLGTTDTLIQHPASMSHSFVPKAQREQFGITDGLIRLSVGLEDVNNIISDLANALR